MSRHLHSMPNTLADMAAQDASLDAVCPLCHAERESYCVNPLTGRHLHNRISHWQRLGARTQEDQK